MKTTTIVLLVLVSLSLVFSVASFIIIITNPNISHITATPIQSPIQPTANYTFVVYRWQGGNVSRDTLDEFAAVRGPIRMDLVFTYRINSAGGMVAYNQDSGGFNIVSSQFEADLTRDTQGWTKTNETVTLPIGIYGSDQGTSYGYLFP